MRMTGLELPAPAKFSQRQALRGALGLPELDHDCHYSSMALLTPAHPAPQPPREQWDRGLGVTRIPLTVRPESGLPPHPCRPSRVAALSPSQTR